MQNGTYVIIAAVISGLSALGGVCLNHYFVRKEGGARLTGKKYKAVDEGLAKAIAGKWVGELLQANAPEGFNPTYRVLAIFDFKRGLANIEFVVTASSVEKTTETRYVGSGGFVKDEIFVADYAIDKPGATSFGHIIFDYHRNGRQMSGRFLGVGDVSGEIVYGYVRLDRQYD